MPDSPVPPGRIADRWLDRALGAVVLTVCYLEAALAPSVGTGLTCAVATLGTLGAVAVTVRRRAPLSLALTFSAACLIPGLVIGARWWEAPSDSFLITMVILAYSVGSCVDGAASVVGLIAICVGSSGGDFSDPVVLVVFTVPAWLAGTAMRSRARLSAQLAERADELQRERETYVREAVRYERARIARDLHDVVAHNLSMIVVQAGAGRRTLASDPTTAAATLRHIQGGAVQAEHEIARLADLLGEREVAGDQRGLDALGVLVQRAAGAGLAVTYTVRGGDVPVAPGLADVAFHVAQEGITNALKHAPGASIAVVADLAADSLSVAVTNGPPREDGTDLTSIGGAHGVTGLRDRVHRCGGNLHAGPTSSGGWELKADMPIASADPLDPDSVTVTAPVE